MARVDSRRLPHTHGAFVTSRGSSPEASTSSRLATVDVQDLAGDECRLIEIEDPLDDVVDFPDPTDGLKVGHTVVGRRIIGLGPDYSKGNSIYPPSTGRVLDGQ